MYDLDRTQSDSDDCTQSDSDDVRCINAGCGNRFDPTSEGFHGECDCCAALAADHAAGAHRGLQVECTFCFAQEPAEGYLVLAAAA
jgi:hypothetical protein